MFLRSLKCDLHLQFLNIGNPFPNSLPELLWWCWCFIFINNLRRLPLCGQSCSHSGNLQGRLATFVIIKFITGAMPYTLCRTYCHGQKGNGHKGKILTKYIHYCMFFRSLKYGLHLLLSLLNCALYKLSEFVNSLTPEKFKWNFRYVIFHRVLVVDDSLVKLP